MHWPPYLRLLLKLTGGLLALILAACQTVTLTATSALTATVPSNAQALRELAASIVVK